MRYWIGGRTVASIPIPPYDSGKLRNWIGGRPFTDAAGVGGASSLTGTGTLAFGPIAFNAASSAALAGTGRLAFGPIAFAASASDRHTGTGVLSFAGISIVAGANDLGAAGAGKRFFWTF